MYPSTDKILYLENNQDTIALVSCVLGSEGYEVISACTILEGLAILQRYPIGLIIINLKLSNLVGMDFICQLRAVDKNTPILVYSAGEYQQVIDEAIETGADDYLIMPDGWNNLIPTVNKLCLRANANAPHF